jgi:hypothetical protein
MDSTGSIWNRLQKLSKTEKEDNYDANLKALNNILSMKTHFLLSLNNLILKTWEQSLMDMAKVVSGFFPDVKTTEENGVQIFSLITAGVL